MKKRLAIVTTHPIQYNAPLFRLLTERSVIDLKVFYTWGNAPAKMFDRKFGILREWDIPLTDGYDFEMLHNYAWMPDSNRFFGILNLGLKQKLSQWKPDAVLVYRWSVWSHFLLLAFFNIKHCRLFFRGDSILHDESPTLKSIFTKRMKQFVFRRVNNAFYVGSRNRRYYENLGLGDNRLAFAPHSIDNQRFQSNADDWEAKAHQVRKQLGFDPEDIVFLYAGKLYGLKNIDLLIRTFKRIENLKFRLLIIGEGEDLAKLKELAKSDQRIIFQPFKNQSEMPWVYRIGNVFVLPSKSESWGLSVNEAMACGLPVIVSKICGCYPDLIVEGETGFGFIDEDDLMYKMSIFNDADLIDKMKVKVLTHITKFNFEVFANSLEQSLKLQYSEYRYN
jgi:glycosyltransferase involved in cell wall biosynthesis